MFKKSFLTMAVCMMLTLATFLGYGMTDIASAGKNTLAPHTAVSSEGLILGKENAARGNGPMVSPAFAGNPEAAADESLTVNDKPVAPAVAEHPEQQGDFGIESVIGTDQRTQVTNTTTYPYSAIVHITSSIGGCTGWMISERTVATAGHCVHSGGSGGSWASNVTVYPGRDGSSTPYGSCSATNLYSVTGWTQDRDWNYDYGAIRLDCTVGNQTGWIGFHTAGSFVGTAENISGYAGDKPYGTQWEHADQVRSESSQKIWYQNDTYGGQSGSPVYETYDSDCGGPCAIGIHAYGSGGGSYNSGTRINSSVYNNLNSWK